MEPLARLPVFLALDGHLALLNTLVDSFRGLPIGTAYAVWTGIGAVGTAIAGILLFGESAAPSRLVCIALIVAGVVGLKFLGK